MRRPLKLAAIAVALAILLLALRAAFRTSTGSEGAMAPAAPPSPGPMRAAGARRPGGNQRPPPPLPSFTDTQLQTCLTDVQRLRREAAREEAESGFPRDDRKTFARLPPSDGNQKLLAPIVDRIFSRFRPRPEHALECRVGQCRLTVLVARFEQMRPWLDALRGDQELASKRGGRTTFGTSITGEVSRDALTGAELREVEVYFDLDDPAAQLPGVALPASLDACRTEMATLHRERAIRQQLEHVAGHEHRLKVDSSYFTAHPLAPALTADFRAVTDALAAAGRAETVRPGECRAARFCRWVIRSPGEQGRRLGQALVARLQAKGHRRLGILSAPTDEGHVLAVWWPGPEEDAPPGDDVP